MGSHLLFLKFLDRLPERQRLYQTLVFTVARAGLMAGLGVFAAVIGARFLGIQHGLWMALGSLYVVLGLAYLAGGAPWLMRQSDRLLPRVPTTSGGAALGVLFGFNIPACAAPLLAVLLGGAAAQAAGGGGVAYGGVSLLTQPGRRLLNAIARFAARMPRITGAVLVLLGVWSIGLAL